MTENATHGRDSTIVLNFTEGNVDPSLERYGRRELIRTMQSFGVDVLVSRGSQAYSEEDGTVDVRRPEITESDGIVSTELGQIALSAVGAIKTISLLEVMGAPPIISDPKVFKLGRDKHHIHRIVATRHDGLMIPTVFVSGRDPSSAVGSIEHDLPGNHLVIKPNAGRDSQGIGFTSKAELPEFLRGISLDGKDHIAQRRLDLTVPLPPYIQGLREDKDTPLLKEANERGYPKEVRLFWFYSDSQPEKSAWYPVARVALPGGDRPGMSADEWVLIDPDKVPAGLATMGRNALEAISQATGVSEIHAAVDLIYARPFGQNTEEPAWYILEVNLRDPVMVHYNEDPKTADILNESLTRQLMRAAEGAQSGYNG